MIGTIFSILTGGGLLGGIAMLVLRPALRATVGGFVKGLPREAWYALVAVAALLGLWFWHSHAVKTAYNQGEANGIVATNAKWNTAFDTMHAAADLWRKNYEMASGRLSDQLRTAHEQDLRDNARLADALSLRGPGHAAAPRCGPSSNSELRTAPGGREPTPAGPGAPAGPVPADDRFAIVPWGWLTQQSREHDDLLDEVKTWRTWHSDQKALHDKAVADLRAQLEAIKVLP